MIPTNPITGGDWEAQDENKGAHAECKNQVTKSGQFLNIADTFQMTKSTIRLSSGQANGMFYVDAGSGSDHILAYSGSLAGFQPHTAYEDGFSIKFVSNFTSDGLTINTIDVNNLGAIDILDSDSGLVIRIGSLVTCTYYNGVFYVDSQSISGNIDLSILQILKNQIGIDTFDNLDDSLKDEDVIIRGGFEWLRYGTSFDVLLYPRLATYFPSGDLPNINEVVRYVPTGSSRTLGDTEDDAIKTHTVPIDSFTVIQNSHNHTQNPHKHRLSIGVDQENTGPDGVLGSDSTAQSGPYNTNVTSTNNPTTSTNKAMTTAQGSYGGESETRMKNISAQKYIKAKVII